MQNDFEKIERNNSKLQKIIKIIITEIEKNKGKDLIEVRKDYYRATKENNEIYFDFFYSHNFKEPLDTFIAVAFYDDVAIGATDITEEQFKTLEKYCKQHEEDNRQFYKEVFYESFEKDLF